MRGRVLLERGDPCALDEALLHRLRCNYYLAIGCHLRAQALAGRDVEKGRLTLAEFLRLAERFDYSYFVRSEESFHPALADLCRSYSITSAWLNEVLSE